MFQEAQDLRALGGQGAEQAHLDLKENQDLLVCLEEMDSLVLRELKDPQV